MSSTNVLSAKDVNTIPAAGATVQESGTKQPDIKSMEYHRQVLQSKMENGEYVLHQASICFDAADMVFSQD